MKKTHNNYFYVTPWFNKEFLLAILIEKESVIHKPVVWLS